MATRTLGIKFEVVGLNKAFEGNRKLNLGIKESIKLNRQNVQIVKQLDRETDRLQNKAASTGYAVEPVSTREIFVSSFDELAYSLEDVLSAALEKLESIIQIGKNQGRSIFENIFTGFYEGIGTTFLLLVIPVGKTTTINNCV